MRRILAAAIVLGLAGCASAPTGWRIGPTIDGRNYSPGYPIRPSPAPGAVWTIPVQPTPAAHLHYVQNFGADLRGATAVCVRYRAEIEPGGAFISREYPDQPPTVSLMLQRRGDDWSGGGERNFYRLFSVGTAPLAAGENELCAPLQPDGWIPVNGTPTPTAAALAGTVTNLSNVGVLFGTSAGRGHGIYSTAPARVTLLEYRVLGGDRL